MTNIRTTPARGLLLSLAIALLGSACTREDTPPPPAAPVASPVPAEVASPPVSADSLTLLEFKIDKNEVGKPALKGLVSNSSPHKIAYATATFKLLDKKGREVGTSTAVVNELKAGFSWNFQVEITQEGVASAKFAGFTAK